MYSFLSLFVLFTIYIGNFSKNFNIFDRIVTKVYKRDFRHSEAPAEESLFHLFREEVEVVLALASYKSGWWLGFSSSLTGQPPPNLPQWGGNKILIQPSTRMLTIRLCSLSILSSPLERGIYSCPPTSSPRGGE